jgi:hypothetical protein
VLCPPTFALFCRPGTPPAALEELGATIDDVVRTRMFITDPKDADEIG